MSDIYLSFPLPSLSTFQLHSPSSTFLLHSPSLSTPLPSLHFSTPLPTLYLSTPLPAPSTFLLHSPLPLPFYSTPRSLYLSTPLSSLYFSTPLPSLYLPFYSTPLSHSTFLLYHPLSLPFYSTPSASTFLLHSPLSTFLLYPPISLYLSTPLPSPALPFYSIPLYPSYSQQLPPLQFSFSFFSGVDANYTFTFLVPERPTQI